MKVAIPVVSDEGLDSRVNEHFGSTPLFLIVDTETKSYQAVENGNREHAHGRCQPVAALNGQAVDGVVVGGIGMGAVMKLRAAGIEVFLSQQPTVSATLDALEQGALQPVDAGNACANHGHGHDHGKGGGCAHK